MTTPPHSLLEPPRLYRGVAIISGDPALAASVSSAIGDEREYVVVLRSPREWPVLAHVWNIDFTIICNTLAKLRPRMLLLLQVTEKSASAFRARLADLPVLSASTLDEALALLSGTTRASLSDGLRCKSSDIAQGLLLAKRRSSLLLVNERAAPASAPPPIMQGADHLVALDDHEDIAPIIAANYAFSIGADLALMPRRDDDLRDDVYAQIDSRVAFRGQERGSRAEVALGEIDARVRRNLQFGSRRFVTFITRGFPYGYFWQDCPSTHVFSRGADITVACGIYWAGDRSDIVSAVMIDPGDFSNSETAEITKRLQAWGTSVIVLRGRHARVQNVRLFLGAFPADLFFICSHCGEVGGQRIQVRIPCHDGEEHLYEVDAILNIASDIRDVEGTEMVLVNELFVPLSMDGENWPRVHSEFKEDWTRFLEKKGLIWERVVSQTATNRVRYSTAIALANGPFVLTAVRHFDPSVSPIVFSNACVSFFAAADQFAAMGARSYIGTLAPVADEMARGFAIEVFASEESLASLPLAIYTVQKRLCSDPHDRIYIHVGCHFSRLAPPTSQNASAETARRVESSKSRWKEYLTRPNAPGKDTAAEYVEFLSRFENDAIESTQVGRVD